MPLTAFQRTVLAVVAPNRSPASLFTGGAVISRASWRVSDDFDMEQHDVAAVEAAFAADRAALEAAGFAFAPTARCDAEAGFLQAEIDRDGEKLRLDWVVDADWRFFPPVRDPDFGWRLTDADIAVNKFLALAGRRALRDYLDVIHLDATGFPIAALAWAASGKDPGFSPSLAVDEAGRHSFYNVQDFALAFPEGHTLDLPALKARFLAALDDARQVVQALYELHPADVGKLCLNSGGAVARPDPALLAAGRQFFHAPSRGGAWPTAVQPGAPPER